jgi:hypothetical protein
MSDTTHDQTLRPATDGPAEAKTQFGMWLKSMREKAGLSLDAVAYETKINKSYLLSLESGDVDALPGKVFGRGFVKCITRLLKTDGAEGLRLYDACWGATIITALPEAEEESQEVHKTKSVMARIAEPINTSSVVTQRLIGGSFSAAGEKPRMPALGTNQSRANLNLSLPHFLVRGFVSPYVRLWVLGGVVTLFVALVFGRWAASNWHKARLDANSNVSVVAASPVAAGGVPALDKVAVEPAKSVALDLQAGKSESIVIPGVVGDVTKIKAKGLAKNEDETLYLPSDASAAFEQVLEINVLNAVEMRLTLDGKKQEDTWFKPDTYRFTFNNLAELYLLDASEVDVIYNGRSLGVLGSKGRKRRVYFQAKAAESDFPK